MKKDKNVTYQIAILAFVFVITTLLVTSAPSQMLSDVNSSFSSVLSFNLANAQGNDEDNSNDPSFEQETEEAEVVEDQDTDQNFAQDFEQETEEAEVEEDQDTDQSFAQ